MLAVEGTGREIGARQCVSGVVFARIRGLWSGVTSVACRGGTQLAFWRRRRAGPGVGRASKMLQQVKKSGETGAERCHVHEARAVKERRSTGGGGGGGGGRRRAAKRAGKRAARGGSTGGGCGATPVDGGRGAGGAATRGARCLEHVFTAVSCSGGRRQPTGAGRAVERGRGGAAARGRAPCLSRRGACGAARKSQIAK